jgi:hypothetical protein
VTVTDRHGATGSAEVTVTVNDPPGNAAPTVRVAADPKAGTAPLRVRFSSAASDPDRDALSHVWDFGDGVKAGGPAAVHTYRTAGTYTATLTVKDPGGRAATASVVVTVAAARRGAAAPPPPATGDVAGDSASSSRMALARTVSVKRVIERGLRLRVTCQSACRVSSLLRIDSRKAERLGVAKARRLAAGTSGTLVVKLDRRVRARLLAAMQRSGLKRLKATVITKVRTDAGTQTLRRKVVLKR